MSLEVAIYVSASLSGSLKYVAMSTGAFGRVASEARLSLDDGPLDKMVLARLAPIVPALVIYYGIVPALGVTGAEAEGDSRTVPIQDRAGAVRAQS